LNNEEENEEEEEDEEEILSSIEDEEPTVTLKHEESLNKSDIENETEEETRTSPIDSSKNKETNVENVSEEASKESSPQSSGTKIKNHDSNCESGFSETENESKSTLSSLSYNSNKESYTKRKKNNSNGYYTSENDGSSSSNEEEIIEERDEANFDKVEEMFEFKSNVKVVEKNNEEIEHNVSNEIEEKPNDNSCESKNMPELSRSSESENDDLSSKKRSPLSNVETKSVEILKENLLRTKILKLPLSLAIKMFLLYNRDI
jgi:hypothetical protein